MDGLWWKTLLKWMIWGYHYFWKHPYICVPRHMKGWKDLPWINGKLVTDINLAAPWTFQNSGIQNTIETRGNHRIRNEKIYCFQKKMPKYIFFTRKNKELTPRFFTHPPTDLGPLAPQKTRVRSSRRNKAPWRTASCHCHVPCEGLQPLRRGCGRWHRNPRRTSHAVGTQHRPWHFGNSWLFLAPLFGKCFL